MRRFASLLVLLPLLGSGCLPRAPEAAVRLEVSYTFKAGCIAVHARDPEGSDREASDKLEVIQRGPSTVVLAVFRQEGWSPTLELTTTAHEQTCDGPEVARDVRTVKLQKKGDIQRISLTLEATDADEDGYIAKASGGTDCDDGDTNSRPGASESCDGRDNDCDGKVDQGLDTKNWYPDQDGDGFGDREATALVSCVKPADSGSTHYVEDATDCRDSDPGVFPRPNVSEARCDDVDEDCDGKVDDGFDTKGTACSTPCPGGQYVCNASHNGLSCNAPAPTLYYPDLDGDDAGDERAAPVPVCPGGTPPASTVANKDDCDDQDARNRRGKPEVCDDRDNNCDSRRDEDNICGGKGWKVLDDAALISTNRQWKTVALGQNGLPVWVAGDGGKLAVRQTAGAAFTGLDGKCGNVNWRAAWVRPTDGHVFLAGDGGSLAEHDGNQCSNQTTVASGNNLTGIIGFAPPATSQLYVVDVGGRLYTWTPGSAPQERYNLKPPTYFGIHGLAPTKLLAVGGTETPTSTPYISSYPGTGDVTKVTEHTVNGVPAGYNGSLRGVWMASSNLAYAVGDSGLVEKWNGAKDWTRVDPPTDSTSAPFTSVVALDPFSVYTTDANTNGAIRRLSAAGSWTTHYTADKPLRDLALSSPGDIWAVGDDGRVVHFPE